MGVKKRIFRLSAIFCALFVVFSIAAGGSSVGIFPLIWATASAESVDNADSSTSSYISLSITSSSPAGSDTNLTLATPEGGGNIATGWHTLKLETSTGISKYSLSLSGSTSVNTTSAVSGQATSTDMIPSLTTNTTLIKSITKDDTALSDNTWGYSLAEPDTTSADTLAAATWKVIPSSSATISTGTTIETGDSVSTNVYYGAKTTNLTQADTYTAKVTYTATAELTPPTITSISPDSYRLDDPDYSTSTVTITGTNLTTVSAVYIDVDDNYSSSDSSTLADDEKCTIVSTADTTITCTIPTDSSISAGTYTVYLDSQAGVVSLEDGFTYRKLRRLCDTSDTYGNVCVDLDAQMIPIKYTGSTSGAQWTVVTDSEIASDIHNWYNYYEGKQWANAVTVTADSLSKYLAAEQGDANATVVNEDDILGYWVYIPRYAYEVKRLNATDKVVTAENFDIHFEVADAPEDSSIAVDTKKTPATSCNSTTQTLTSMWTNGTANNTASNIAVADYRTGCGISRTYGDATDTTWATHPAFTFGTKELNGFWIGKFELTGTTNAPTVKPNRVANASTTFGDFYDSIKSIGVTNDENTGGNNYNGQAKGAVMNSHSLNYLNSSMLKNDQWGAAAYLSASDFGAGVNKTFNNAAAVYYYQDSEGVYHRITDDEGGSVTDACRYSDGTSEHDIGCFTSNANGYSGTGKLTDGTYDGTGVASYNSGVALNKYYCPSDDTCYTVRATYQNRGSQTGCGPYDINGSTTPYRPCNLDHQYQSAIGQLASTTNNIYGVYDMAGGLWEYVSGEISSSSTTTQWNVSTPWANIWPTTVLEGVGGFNNGIQTWSVNTTNQYLYNNDWCTWDTCGGQALHETKSQQSVASYYASWGSDLADFAYSGYPWLFRGGRVGDTSSAGLFASYYRNGGAVIEGTSRAALAVY